MTPLSSPEFLHLQSAVAGRFSIEREIGRGGMGLVFLARDVQLDRHVAIKLLAPHLAARPEMRRRFLREARIAAQCFHPHIVPIHAVEEAGELAFFVMSYVRGETLAQRVARAGPLPPALVERIGREVGWALSYAHDRGVVHRDIKPENILLEQGTDRCLLSDFGIALLDDPERTPQSGEVAGTATYMAPEQALGEAIDGRADLYALGVTLFLAATGRHPFRGESTVALMVQHAMEPAPPVRSLAPRLSESVADAIDRCLAKRAADRFHTAAEFVASFDSAPLPSPMPRDALPVHGSARATEALVGWGATVGASTALFMLGEAPRSFARGLMQSMGNAVTLFLLAAAALRATEALLAARRALKAGASSDDIVRAIAGDPVVDESIPLRQRLASAGTIVVAGSMAVLQGPASAAGVNLGEPFSAFIQITLLILPPFIMGRGAATALRHSTAAAWARRQLLTPLARGIVRLFGARPSAARPEERPLAPVHTEVLLDRAALELFAELAPAQRSELAALPDAINALSRDAESLRRADRALGDAERAARAAGRAADDAERLAIVEQRDRIRHRLATTIAALETIRLDLMRLAAGAIDSAGMTTHLGVIRELEHRIAADEEVRVLLERPLGAGATS